MDRAANTKSPRLNYFPVLISLAHNTNVLDFFAIETVRTRNDAYHPWRTETGYASGGGSNPHDEPKREGVEGLEV